MTDQPVSEHAGTHVTSGETATADADDVLVDRTTGDEPTIDPLRPVMMQSLRDGGLEANLRTDRTLDPE